MVGTVYSRHYLLLIDKFHSGVRNVGSIVYI